MATKLKEHPAKAKPQVPAVQRSTKMVGGLPDHLKTYVSKGIGVPTDVDDFQIPMAKVLNPLNPEVLKSNANYVEDAEAGDILIKNAPVPLIKASDGLIFQCAHKDRSYAEWVPRSKGGGWAGRHPFSFVKENPDAVHKEKDPQNPKLSIWVLNDSGNHLVDTRYYSGFMLSPDDSFPPMPLVIPFSKSGHSVAKAWNLLMFYQYIENDLGRQRANVWLPYYFITTKLRQSGEHSWYLFDVGLARDDEGRRILCQTKEDEDRGKLLAEQLAKGDRQIAPDFDVGDAPATETDDDDM